MMYRILALMLLSSMNIHAMKKDKVIPASQISDELASVSASYESDEETGYETRALQFVWDLKEMLDISDKDFDEDMQNYLEQLIQRGIDQINYLEDGIESKTIINCCGIKKKKQLLTRTSDRIKTQKERLEQLQTKCDERRTVESKGKKKKDRIGKLVSTGAQAALLAILEEAKQQSDEQDTALQEKDTIRKRWKYGSIVGGSATICLLLVQSGIIPATIGLATALIESYAH